VDYYDESTLIWLEVDTLIREKTGGKKSLDDFCRAFHGGEGNEPKLIPYTLDDVAAALNGVVANDWKKFLLERVRSHGRERRWVDSKKADGASPLAAR